MFLKSKLFKVQAAVIAFAIAVVSFVSFVDVNTMLYQTNIMSLPEHEPFDGTVYPVQKVPNWSKLSADKRDAHYSELSASDLLPIPYYDPDVLVFPNSDLVWGNAEHDKVRNAKITYSVPYMGNYRLDGEEYAGSHPAVDIKIPTGTPIYAMSNGVVSKASTQNDGFGHHIVLTHRNFPTLENENVRETIHSSYSHLSEVLVSVGDVVRKGDKIGLSGDTGTATTPHVHFQIDRKSSPWQPFWPFTWQEVHEAGLDFFSAINEGLGKERALEVTVNPMRYVQKYLDADGTYSEPEDKDEKPLPDSYIENEDSPKKGPESSSYLDDEEDEDEEKDEVKKDPIDDDIIMSDPPSQDDTVLRFSDVSETDEFHEAITFLAEKDIIQGYEDGTFRPDEEVNRVEALKFILESIDAELRFGTAPFSDISDDEWYYEYLYTGYHMAIVDGHPDGTFRPEDNVNRAEFFKILFNGMRVDIDPVVEEPPYDDVATDDWFAHYLTYAKELKILDSNLSKVFPDQAMTRGEVADAMFRLIQVAG